MIILFHNSPFPDWPSWCFMLGNEGGNLCDKQNYNFGPLKLKHVDMWQIIYDFWLVENELSLDGRWYFGTVKIIIAKKRRENVSHSRARKHTRSPRTRTHAIWLELISFSSPNDMIVNKSSSMFHPLYKFYHNKLPINGVFVFLTYPGLNIFYKI